MQAVLWATQGFNYHELINASLFVLATAFTIIDKVQSVVANTKPITPENSSCHTEISEGWSTPTSSQRVNNDQFFK